MLKSPLEDHRSYIFHIALENYTEYFRLGEAYKQSAAEMSQPEEFKLLRYYLNAVESLNNIPDYLYFDENPTHANPSPTEFRKALLAATPCLRQLADIANAYKHCVRGQPKGGRFSVDVDARHARDLASTSIDAEIYSESGDLKISMNFSYTGISEQDIATLSECFRYWLAYANREREIEVPRSTT